MLVVIEINLVLWLILLGNALVNEGSLLEADSAVVDGKIILVGVGFAAVVQHIVYYCSRTKSRKESISQLGS